MNSIDIRDWPEEKWTMTHFEAALFKYQGENGKWPEEIIITPLHLGSLFDAYNHLRGQKPNIDSYHPMFEGIKFVVKRNEKT